MSTWGLAKDEFADNGNWPYNLYIRETQRMKSDFVKTENHCQHKLPIEDSVGLGAYTLDSHGVLRIDSNGVVKNESDIQTKVSKGLRHFLPVLRASRGWMQKSVSPLGFVRHPHCIQLDLHRVGFHGARSKQRHSRLHRHRFRHQCARCPLSNTPRATERRPTRGSTSEEVTG